MQQDVSEHQNSKSPRDRTITASWITAGAAIVAAIVGGIFLLASGEGGRQANGGQPISAKAAACRSAQKAVKNEVNALGSLLNSLSIRNAGTANAAAIRIIRTPGKLQRV
jgi:hypothetical protein